MMASQTLLTEANQHEMQQTLKKLTSRHKKAKLQELFHRQDELRPFTSNNDEKQTPKSPMPTKEDIEAMKIQFNDLQKCQLEKQISKQFDLRNLSDTDVSKQQSFGNGSDTSGDIKVNEEDLAAMKEDFDTQRKLLLNTRFEKSFRLRTECDHDNENREDDEYSLSLSESEKDGDKRLIEEFQAMNKEIIRQRTSNHLTMTEEPKITSEHKLRFHGLMRDIGIVNDNILESLWTNVENTIDPKVESEDVTDGGAGNVTQNDILSRLEKENEALREKVDKMQKELDAMRKVELRDGRSEMESDCEMEIIN